jgi:hypothetical protein
MSDSDGHQRPDTYVVEIEKRVEIDFPEKAGEALRQKESVGSVRSGLARMIASEERNAVEPEEKLLRLEVEVHED